MLQANISTTAGSIQECFSICSPCESCVRIFQILWVTQSTNAIPLIAAGCVELTKDAVIAGIFAGRACVVKGVLADTAKIIFGKIPSPCRDPIPPLDLDLHRWQISGESNNPVAYRVVLVVGSLCWSVYGVSHPMLRAGEVLAPPLSVLPATAAKC